MASAVLSDHEIPSEDELIGLYASVGWATYAAQPERLHAAVARSLRVVSARDGESLVGLARVVRDGISIVYLQDILVAPGYQGQGIGAALMKAALEPFDDVRQQVLLTDDEPRQRAFYEAMGFTEIRNVKDSSLRAFIRFT